MPSFKPGDDVVLFSPQLRRFVEVRDGQLAVSARDANTLPDLGPLSAAERGAASAQQALDAAKDALEDARKAWAKDMVFVMSNPKRAKKAKDRLDAATEAFERAKKANAQAEQELAAQRQAFAAWLPARLEVVDAGGGRLALRSGKAFLQVQAEGRAGTVTGNRLDPAWKGVAFTVAESGGTATFKSADPALFFALKDKASCTATATESAAARFQVQVSGAPVAAALAGAATATPTTTAPSQPAAPGAPVVLDVGSAFTRVGRAAAGAAPTAVFPTVVGRPKSTMVMVGSSSSQVKVGDEAVAGGATLTLKWPVNFGLVEAQRWSDYEEVLKHAFTAQLRTVPETQPLLLAECAQTPGTIREQLTRIAFETLRVPAFALVNEAVLALASEGRSTGTVVSVGDSVTFVTPVYEGKVLSHAVQRLALAGRDVTNLLLKLLAERGYTLTTSREYAAVNGMKETRGFVALDYDEALKKAADPKLAQPYELPGGQVISLKDEQFRCAEALFKPALVGLEDPGIHALTHAAILKCDVSIRKDLYGSIVLAGGSTMFPGFAERLQKELGALAPPTEKVTVIASPARRYAAWHGGAKVAGAAGFAARCITTAEYDQAGPAIVHTRFPT